MENGGDRAGGTGPRAYGAARNGSMARNGISYQPASRSFEERRLAWQNAVWDGMPELEAATPTLDDMDGNDLSPISDDSYQRHAFPPHTAMDSEMSVPLVEGQPQECNADLTGQIAELAAVLAGESTLENMADGHQLTSLLFSGNPLPPAPEGVQLESNSPSPGEALGGWAMIPQQPCDEGERTRAELAAIHAASRQAVKYLYGPQLASPLSRNPLPLASEGVVRLDPFPPGGTGGTMGWDMGTPVVETQERACSEHERCKMVSLAALHYWGGQEKPSHSGHTASPLFRNPWPQVCEGLIQQEHFPSGRGRMDWGTPVVDSQAPTFNKAPAHDEIERRMMAELAALHDNSRKEKLSHGQHMTSPLFWNPSPSVSEGVVQREMFPRPLVSEGVVQREMFPPSEGVVGWGMGTSVVEPEARGLYEDDRWMMAELAAIHNGRREKLSHGQHMASPLSWPREDVGPPVDGGCAITHPPSGNFRATSLHIPNAAKTRFAAKRGHSAAEIDVPLTEIPSVAHSRPTAKRSRSAADIEEAEARKEWKKQGLVLVKERNTARSRKAILERARRAKEAAGLDRVCEVALKDVKEWPKNMSERLEMVNDIIEKLKRRDRELSIALGQVEDDSAAAMAQVFGQQEMLLQFETD